VIIQKQGFRLRLAGPLLKLNEMAMRSISDVYGITGNLQSHPTRIAQDGGDWVSLGNPVFSTDHLGRFKCLKQSLRHLQ